MSKFVVPQSAPSVLAIQSVLDAAVACALDTGVSACIAVVDMGGALAGFLRIPGAFLVSSDLAIDKAWTAAGIGADTRSVGGILQSLEPAVCEGLLRRPRMTVVPGGLPIELDGVRIGAIGVSGGSAEQDEQIAKAGLAALAEKNA